MGLHLGHALHQYICTMICGFSAEILIHAALLYCLQQYLRAVGCESCWLCNRKLIELGEFFQKCKGLLTTSGHCCHHLAFSSSLPPFLQFLLLFHTLSFNQTLLNLLSFSYSTSSRKMSGNSNEFLSQFLFISELLYWQ